MRAAKGGGFFDTFYWVPMDESTFEFEKGILLKRNLTFYVRNKSLKEVEIIYYKKKSEIGHGRIEDYKILFKYFELIYGEKRDE